MSKVTVADATYDGNPHGATAKVTGAGGLDQSLTVTYSGRNGTVLRGRARPRRPTPVTTRPAPSYGGDANHKDSSDSVNYSIDGAPLKITAEDKTGQYSDPRPAFTWKYDGFVNSEGPGVLSGTTACATTALTTAAGNIASPAGDYPISCSGQTGANYDITYIQGKLKVTKEDAQTEYTGDTLVTLGSGSTTSVRLAGVIREAADGTLGDKLGTTSLAFSVYKSSDAALASPVATCTAAMAAAGSGAAAGGCTVSLGEDTFVVRIQLVTNGYYTAPVEDAATTVVVPGPGARPEAAG